MDSSSSWPAWHLQRDGEAAELQLIGDWIARDSGVRGSEEIRRILEGAGGGRLRVDASGLGRWDSALIAFLKLLGDSAAEGRSRPVQLDTSALPEAARQLLTLAAARPAGIPPTRAPLPSSIMEVSAQRPRRFAPVGRN